MKFGGGGAGFGVAAREGVHAGDGGVREEGREDVGALVALVFW